MQRTLPELRTAIDIAREAGALLSDFFHRRVAVESKGEFDIVTEADRASERLIVQRLRDRLRYALVRGSAGRHDELRAQLSDLQRDAGDGARWRAGCRRDFRS